MSKSRGKLKFFLHILTVLCVFFSLSSSLLFIHAEEPAARRKVKVGYFIVPNFQEYNSSSSSYHGYSHDYMMAIAQYANWDYEFVPVTYQEGIKKLQNGELDLMNYVNPEDGYSNLSYSTLPSGESWINLVVSLDNTTVSYEDFDAIANLKVGLVYTSIMNSSFVDYCKYNDCMPRLVYYHTEEELQNAMDKNEVDSYIVSSLSDVKMRTVAKISTSSYYFATTKGNNDLLSELNDAMNNLKTDDPYYQERLYSHYHTGSTEDATIISSSEQDYINSSGPVQVLCMAEWYPVSYYDSSQQFKGAIASLLTEITDRTGLQFNMKEVNSIEEAQQSLEDGTCDMMAGFPYDYAWANTCHATLCLPFSSCTMMQVTKNNKSIINKVAVIQDSYQEYFVQSISDAGYTYYRYQNIDECLQAVQDGTVDSTIIDSLQAQYYNKLYQYRTLNYEAISGGSLQLSLAVADQSDPALLSILNKSISSIGTQKINNMFDQAVIDSESKHLVDQLYSNQKFAAWFYSFLGFLAAAIISVVFYGRRIKHKNEQLQEATTAKQAFLSNISHDMRTPLNGIIGYTDLALREKNQPATQDYLNKVKISGQFLLSLINDTLDISKIESGKYVLKPEKIDTDELIQSIVIPIQASADQKNISLHVDLDKMYHGMIIVDSLNLRKVILNLLGNAVKFTPEGGKIDLEISEIEPIDGCNCKIVVRDSGIGISEEIQKKMFEPFTQEQGSVGTGLGLSIVKRIITLMNGSITVKSQLGKGTEFTVLISIQHAKEEALPVTMNADSDDLLKGRKILLCEDNEMNTEIAVAVLKNLGIETDTAKTGKIGLEQFKQSELWHYDLILMDRRMPEMDGNEAARCIRALDRIDAKQIPIIAMTADAYDEGADECKKAGMNGYVTKPIDPESFRQELLKKFRMEDEVRKREEHANERR